ncbi:MAG TPA: SDR family oxidoreductase [Bdellovibrionales bacterium]|nr:SDR family oxidoreductase [Bdellovibrionales bacterium]
MRILITGGSSDIGRAIALRRLRLGDEVFVTASSVETLTEAQAAFAASGFTVDGFVFDLRNPASASEELDRVLAKGIDGLVLNAATRLPKLRLFHEMDENHFTNFFNENTHGNVWILKRTLNSMIERGFGRLVFISSLTAVQGTSRYSVYSAAKAAIEGLFLNLAVDYGHQDILSTIVRPGIIATERNRRFWRRSGYVERVSNLIPQGKIGLPDQVAEAIDPLLSKTSYMNGSIIEVTGGLPRFRSGALV